MKVGPAGQHELWRADWGIQQWMPLMLGEGVGENEKKYATCCCFDIYRVKYIARSLITSVAPIFTPPSNSKMLLSIRPLVGWRHRDHRNADALLARYACLLQELSRMRIILEYSLCCLFRDITSDV